MGYKEKLLAHSFLVSLFFGPIWFYVNHSFAYTRKLLENLSQVSDVDYGPDLVNGSAEGLEFYIGKEPFEISALVKVFDTLNIWMPRVYMRVEMICDKYQQRLGLKGRHITQNGYWFSMTSNCATMCGLKRAQLTSCRIIIMNRFQFNYI